jgi:general secretion pathway protein C
VNLARARRVVGPFVDAAPTLAVLALLVLAGWLAARWVLYFAAPVEAPAVSGRERVQLGVAAQALSDAHLFGVAPAGAGGEAVSNLNIKLKGVFASRADAPSMAIINTGDRDETARVGGEIVPGVVLEAVHPRHVMLRRNGALERVNLEEPQRAAAAPVPRAAPRRAQALTQAPQTPLQGPARSPAARFQRPEPYAPVGDVPTEPTPVAAPAPPPAPVPAPGVPGASQGLVIQSVPPGSLLERFGLLPGDVVRSVNGEAVRSEADVARILQGRGLQGPFTAEVERGGATVPISVNAQR